MGVHECESVSGSEHVPSTLVPHELQLPRFPPVPRSGLGPTGQPPGQLLKGRAELPVCPGALLWPGRGVPGEGPFTVQTPPPSLHSGPCVAPSSAWVTSCPRHHGLS